LDFIVHIAGRSRRVRVLDGAVEVDGVRLDVDLAPSGGSVVRSVRVAGQSLRLLPHRNGTGEWTLSVEGVRYLAEVLDPGQEAVRLARRSSAAGAGPQPLRAPMPGLVIRIDIAEGDLVSPGDGLLIVEAMKMENELRAMAPARVHRVHVSAGDAVEKNQLLVEFEAGEEVS